MKGYPKSINDCIKELKECAKNAEYCEIESLLTWSSAYLRDLKEYYISNEPTTLFQELSLLKGKDMNHYD